MRQTLRHGSTRFEILDVNEDIMTFRDLPAARTFVRSFERQADQIGVLRRALQQKFPAAHSMSAEEMLERLASLLANGSIRLLKLPHILPSGGDSGPDSANKTNQSQQNSPGPQKKKSWIEIYLRDTNGKPVPGERFCLKLPDGSIQEGRLDAFGHVEYYGINPGNCQISFPDIDEKEWKKV